MSQNSTAHWSIGEVLSLLQEEFPEVTISKIRFLESQGLIDPERTPSGYRRFYDSDFDRLRWILVQQRDHYLPLKVIRDRLQAADELGGSAPESGDDIAVVPEDPVGVAESEVRASASQIAEPTVLDLTDDAAVPAESLVLPPADVERVDVVPNPQPQPEPEVNAFLPGQGGPGGPVEAVVETEADAVVEDQGEFEVDALIAELVEKPLVETPLVEAAAKEDAAETDRAVEDAAAGAEEAVPVEPEESVALSREELAEAVGCDSRLLHELERYNLISGRTLGSNLVFGADDLEVARTAVAFGERGLDPRHLRAFRLSAEREVGLVAQIIEPMLHRRSVGAREASLQSLAEMMDLATALHDSMVRQVVAEQFPDRY